MIQKMNENVKFESPTKQYYIKSRKEVIDDYEKRKVICKVIYTISMKVN